MLSQWSTNLQPYALGLLRIVAGWVYMQHGLAKFGFLEGRVVEFPRLLWFAGANETLFGALILVGLFTRPAAFLMCGQMAIAYFSSHLPRGFYPLRNGGEPAILFCFIFLLIATAGAGKFSLDGLLCGRKSARA